MARGSQLLALCVLAASCAALPAWAQSRYQQQVSVTMGVDHDTNPGLRAENARSASRLRLNPRYTLLRQGDVDTVSLSLGATIEKSSDEAVSRNRQDPNARVQWQHAWVNTVLGLNAGYARSSLREALLEDTGQLTSDGTRTVKNLGATLSHQLSPLYRTSGGLQAQWTRDTGTSGNPDSRQNSANAELSRSLDATSEVYVAGQWTSFEPDRVEWELIPGFILLGPSNRSIMRSMDVGYRNQIDEVWHWNVSAGMSKYTGPISDRAFKGQVQLGYSGQRWNVTGAWSRQPVTDSLRGTFSQSQQLRLNADYAWDELTRIGMNTYYTRTMSTQRNTTRGVGMSLSRELSPLWRATLQLSHRQVNRKNEGLAWSSNEASGSSAYVYLTYTHPDF